MNFERARTKEQIENRHNEIIGACEVLFDTKGYEGVNFKAISEMTSLTRSSIYNYYNTKDEILLDLLKREMLEWRKTLIQTMKATKEMTKDEYSNCLTQLLLSNEKMLKLFSLLFTTIENNCEIEKLADFKKEIIQVIDAVAESVDMYFPTATEENKAVFVSAFFSYIMGLYPMSSLSEKQIEAIEYPGIDYVAPNFEYMCYQGIILLLSAL